MTSNQCGRHRRLATLDACRGVVLAANVLMVVVNGACSRERLPVPASSSVDGSDASFDAGAPAAAEAEPLRTKLSNGTELYVPSWFHADASYDLIVHFHGLPKLQEANLEKARLNAAIVSVNLGTMTEVYGNAFRDPQAFTKLLGRVEEEMDRSGRARGARVNRIALSAWSAGFVAVSKVLGDATHGPKVDAVLLADGFFTSYSDVKKRTINTSGVERFARFAEAASRGEKLFAITHTKIPTYGYPSVEDTVAKLLAMTSRSKTPTATTGPNEMHETYVVDVGDFHVKGYEGVTAVDHIKQINTMGETLYPYLKTRWDARASTTATR